MKMQHHTHENEMGNKMYYKFALMIILSFIAMYILMYAMVDSFSNVFPNVNQFYMAGLMTMPMVILELAIMGGMYMKKKLNMALMAIGLILGIGFFFGIRQQTGVGDRQFLRSMIPHHGAAILMVEKAKLTDPEIKQLAQEIITAQEAEIAQMKAKLEEIKKK
ncbi:DUF305 domain-containing protein [Flavobacterium sp.]|uniref:DUF305 domain-containing protein n=1 Tax=Flavobacterium sp. TaxID=239 RepID=UPI0026367BD8|nr:DUF305 domain-containing protein [Flavobacterium sp.]